MVHRDIKPENILLDLSGKAKISDFGLSRIVANNDLDKLTVGVGTPKYKSPEMIDNYKNYSSKIDVWSLGITLYEMIFGYTPWDGDSLPTLYNNVKNTNFSFPT